MTGEAQRENGWIRSRNDVVALVLLASGPRTATELAGSLRISRQGAHKLLARLQRAGLVDRVADADGLRFSADPALRIERRIPVLGREAHLALSIQERESVARPTRSTAG